MKKSLVPLIVAAMFASSLVHAAPSSAAEAPVVKPEVVLVASDPCKGYTTADKAREAGRGGRGYALFAPAGCR